MTGRTDIVKILVEKQSEKNPENQPEIEPEKHSENQPEGGSTLASIVNYQNFDGTTPLMLCSAGDHIDVVRYFIRNMLDFLNDHLLNWLRNTSQTVCCNFRQFACHRRTNA
jgi:hypothetical protein